MKKAFISVVGFISLLVFVHPAYAAGGTCIKKEGFCPQGYDYSTTVHLSEYGTSSCKADAATVPGNGDYGVCCSTIDEINSKFSVQAPLCGSSDELGKANSSCWQCGSTVRCAGADPNLAFGFTDPVIMQSRNPVNADDPTDRVWRVPGSAIGEDGFTFNGQKYAKPDGDVIVCMSNLTGCGASEVSCTNIRHPEYTTDEQGIYYNGELFKTWGTGGLEERVLANPGSNPGNPIFGRIYLGFLGPIDRYITTQIAQSMRWQNNIHEGMSAFERIGAITEETVTGPLMPAIFQDQFQPVDWPADKLLRNPLRAVTLGRLCIYGTEIDQPTGRTPKDNIPLEGAIVTTGMVGSDSQNPRFWAQTLSSRLFTEYWIPGAGGYVNLVAPNGDPVEITEIEEDGRIFYDTPLDQVDDVVYPCRSSADGAPLRNVDTEGDGIARTPAGGPGGIIGSISGFLTGIIDRLKIINPIVESCGPDNSRECEYAPWEIVSHDSLPGDLAAVSQTIGLSINDLHRGMSAHDRAELAADGGSQVQFSDSRGGWVRTFLPQELTENIEYVHANAPQNVELGGSLIGGSVNREAYPRWLKGVADAFTCTVDNLIIPDAMQTTQCPWVDAQSEQHGALGLPDDINMVGPQITPPPAGDILGQDYLEQYEKTLITLNLTPQQRALLMARIQELIDRYVSTGAWPGSELGNTALQDQLRQFAQDNGFNEAFLYALWIEETHASSVGDYPFGCGGYTDFSSSLNCIANDPTVQTYIRGDLYDALCMYADGHRNCDFSAHPNFVRNLMYYYDYLTQP